MICLYIFLIVSLRLHLHINIYLYIYIVIPPPQHLYLLAENHKDSHDKTAHDEMGFDDFFDLNLLRSNKVG